MAWKARSQSYPPPCPDEQHSQSWKRPALRSGIVDLAEVFLAYWSRSDWRDHRHCSHSSASDHVLESDILDHSLSRSDDIPPFRRPLPK